MVLCTHYSKNPRKTQQTVSKHKLSHHILEGYWWQEESLPAWVHTGSDLPYKKWFSDIVGLGRAGGVPPKSILRLKLASLGLSTRIDKPAKSSLNLSENIPCWEKQNKQRNPPKNKTHPLKSRYIMCFCIYCTSDIVKPTRVSPDKNYLIIHSILLGELRFRSG